jgi:hypothetical protein
MPTLAPPKPSPTTPVRRMHRWACTVWCGTDYELRVEVFAVDREAARSSTAATLWGFTLQHLRTDVVGNSFETIMLNRIDINFSDPGQTLAHDPVNGVAAFSSSSAIVRKACRSS